MNPAFIKYHHEDDLPENDKQFLNFRSLVIVYNSGLVYALRFWIVSARNLS